MWSCTLSHWLSRPSFVALLVWPHCVRLLHCKPSQKLDCKKKSVFWTFLSYQASSHYPEISRQGRSFRPSAASHGVEAVSLDRWLRGRKHHMEEMYYDTGPDWIFGGIESAVTPVSSEYRHPGTHFHSKYGHPAVKIGTPCKQ